MKEYILTIDGRVGLLFKTESSNIRRTVRKLTSANCSGDPHNLSELVPGPNGGWIETTRLVVPNLNRASVVLVSEAVWNEQTRSWIENV